MSSEKSHTIVRTPLTLVARGLKRKRRIDPPSPSGAARSRRATPGRRLCCRPNNSSKPPENTTANMALDFAATYKVLVLGDSNVGKTCIVHRYCDERYYDTYISTIGIDFKQKIINLDGTPIKLQIWDTAGQERFRTLTTAYYRGAMGILLMYDVTSLESFNHLSYWLRNIQENASPDVVKVLAANKCDATAHRAVDAERGQKIAENFDMPFFEVSCKENINIEEAFLTLARRIREQRGRRASLFEASEREGADSIIKAQSPSQQGDAWRCTC
ncbi:ras-related protein Rab-8A [Nylanderia fulva]|uniref:ras-related protein Rab-8A n=1 Tax=Nylanderia fulva TaxID=613905 RepID=UPI0010FB5E91|nr:ras-related protein Rab-8A [Nylanderia fulva]